MAYSLPDGTKIDQVIFDDLELRGNHSIESDFISVPALYTGRLKVIIIGSRECELMETALVTIDYYDYNKKHIWNYDEYVCINSGNYNNNEILSEFNIPYRILKTKPNNDKKAYYIRISINLLIPLDIGKISAYLIWE